MLARWFAPFLLAGLASSHLALSASAADLPSETVSPPIFTGLTWEGAYVGINWGIAYGSSRWLDGSGLFGLPAPYIALPARTPIGGLIAGGTLGVNHQIGAFVFGLEGDVDGGQLDGHANCGGYPGIGGLGFVCHTQANVLGSLTGRLGYASGSTLYYVKAGAAAVRDKTNYSDFYYLEFGSSQFEPLRLDAGDRRRICSEREYFGKIRIRLL